MFQDSHFPCKCFRYSTNVSRSADLSVIYRPFLVAVVPHNEGPSDRPLPLCRLYRLFPIFPPSPP